MDVNSSRQPQVGGGALRLSVHARVRYLERYVDKDAVQTARTAAQSDHAILDAVAANYADELARFEHQVATAYSRLQQRHGTIPLGAFTLRTGSLAVAIKGETCTTTLPAVERRKPRRSHRSARTQRNGWEEER